jgi:hypothetical protein
MSIYAEYSDLTTEALERKLERAQLEMWRAERPVKDAKREYDAALADLKRMQDDVSGIEAELKKRREA